MLARSWNRLSPRGSCSGSTGIRRCWSLPGLCFPRVAATCNKPVMRNVVMRFRNRGPALIGCFWIWDFPQINSPMTAAASASNRMGHWTCDLTRQWGSRPGNGWPQSANRNWKVASDTGARCERAAEWHGLSWNGDVRVRSRRVESWLTASPAWYRGSAEGDILRRVSSRRCGSSSMRNWCNWNGLWQRPLPHSSCREVGWS